MIKTYIVQGNQELNGEVEISGSKNCALVLIASSTLVKGRTILHHIPHIEDILNMIIILNKLHVDCRFVGNDLLIDTTNMEYEDLLIPEISKLRGSYYLIGSLLHRYHKLKISNFGGCTFVDRPINYHLDFFKYFGCEYYQNEQGYVFIENYNNKKEYTLPYPSFGTTINAILYGISLNQEIVIHNISLEIEIITFIDFLKAMNAIIKLKDNSIYIYPSKLQSTEFNNIPDRIECGTFMLIGLSLCKKLIIHNFIKQHNQALIDLFDTLDIKYDINDNTFSISKQEIKKSCVITTGGINHIPSDLQPLLTVFCLTIPRISLIKEQVYKSRFTHIEPLKKMGACIYESNGNILINGIMPLLAKEVYSTDLRMGASMVYVGLLIEGTSIIHNINYIDRGYENFLNKLKSLGAKITAYEK